MVIKLFRWMIQYLLLVPFCFLFHWKEKSEVIDCETSWLMHGHGDDEFINRHSIVTCLQCGRQHWSMHPAASYEVFSCRKKTWKTYRKMKTIQLETEKEALLKEGMEQLKSPDKWTM